VRPIRVKIITARIAGRLLFSGQLGTELKICPASY
jgi:hypothetical protein